MMREILIPQFMTHLIILLIVSSIAIISCFSQSRIQTRPLHLAWTFDVQLVPHFFCYIYNIIDTSNHELLSGVLLLLKLIWLTKLILSMAFEGDLGEKKDFTETWELGSFHLGQ